jgi:phosphohistidine phosphatase
MPTFVLVRHAKAERPPGVPDIARELAPRGQRDAFLVGRYLGEHLPPPAAIITSPARRAHHTADLVCEAAGWPSPTTIDALLYEGGVDDVLGTLRRAGTGPIVIFGHQPTWSATVAALTGQAVGMPTGAAACVEGEARPGGGTLLWVVTPADLGGGGS